jgi:hypothetical protein
MEAYMGRTTARPKRRASVGDVVTRCTKSRSAMAAAERIWGVGDCYKWARLPLQLLVEERAAVSND